MFRKKKVKNEEDIVSELTVPTSGDDWLAEYGNEGQLSVDVYQTPNEVYVRAPIAGVKPEDVEVVIENGVLNIKGKRKDELQIKEEDFYMKECFWGAFARSISLPVEVDENRVQASLKDGILVIKISKLRREKGKPVKVKLSTK